MNEYFDTSFLVSAYVRDAHSPLIVSILNGRKTPIPLTSLVKHELRNAIRLCVFRDELTATTCREVLADIDGDLKSGVLQETPLTQSELWKAAETLGEKFTAKFGARSLDTLHVAAAEVLGARLFYTFDAWQARLAIKAGLKVLPSVR